MLNYYILIFLFMLSFDYAPASPQWDLLIFTQNWPATICKEWKEKNQRHTCSWPKYKNSWSIHGIWPTKLGTIGPAYCNKTWLFDPEQIKPIETNLTQFWTNVEEGTSTYALWSHEWYKHGTCAASLETLNSERKYFGKGLEWVQKYVMSDILQRAGITPSNDHSYFVTDVSNAVKKELGIAPFVVCKNEYNRSYITELRICFNKELELMDCTGIKYKFDYNVTRTNCNDQIFYPLDSNIHAPKRIYLQLYKLIEWLQWLTL